MIKLLDKIDREILEILQHDSSLSIKEIAEKVGLSTTPTYERIKALEENGIILKYVALIDRKKVGIDFLVYCYVMLKEQSKKASLEFERAVSKIPEIVEVTAVSGSYAYMLKIAATNLGTYNDFVLNVLSNLPHIGQHHSSIVMSEVKYQTAFKIS